jgi:hypothetical protein
VGKDVSLAVTAAVLDTDSAILQENRIPGLPPTPSRIHAESNGGAVKTSVSFRAGAGRPGSSLEMVDIATGDTAGALTLEQTAWGGGGAPSAPLGNGQFIPAGPAVMR